MRVLILQGLPGSGKSTFAEKNGYACVSADQWYMEDGVYQYNRKNSGKAHAWRSVRDDHGNESCVANRVASTVLEAFVGTLHNNKRKDVNKP